MTIKFIRIPCLEDLLERNDISNTTFKFANGLMQFKMPSGVES